MVKRRQSAGHFCFTKKNAKMAKKDPNRVGYRDLGLQMDFVSQSEKETQEYVKLIGEQCGALRSTPEPKLKKTN